MTASTNKAGRFLKYVILIVVVINLAIVAVVFLGANEWKPRPMPNPNGYDDFVKAGQMLMEKPGDFDKMSKKELAELVATNQEALRLVRAGLGRECRVPDDYSPEYLARITSPAQLSSFKQLAMLITAEGKSAELAGRSNDAAEIYLEGIRFGQKSAQGGVIISRLVGIAGEAFPMGRLELLANRLDGPACHQIAQALEVIDAEEEPVEETLNQEKLWARKAGGWREQINALIQYKSIRDVRTRSTKKIRANTLRRRQLILTLAARAFELEKGIRAQSAADLVPGYLKAIPQDPTTGTNLALGP
jgi:hypothetical protein